MPAMRRCAAVVVVLALLAAASEAATVNFLKGSVATSRSLLEASTGAAGGARKLAQAAKLSKDAIWVMSVPAAEHRAVKAALQAQQGKLLHTIESGNWLVRSEGSTIAGLLKQFPDVTAAEFPANFKLSPAVEQLLSTMDNLIASGLRVPDLEDLPRELRNFAHDSNRKFKTVKSGAPSPSFHAELAGLTPETSAPLIQLLAASLEGRLRAEVSRQLPEGQTCVVKVTPMPHAVKVSVCLQFVRLAADMVADSPEVTWVQLNPETFKQQDLQSSAAMQGSAVIDRSYPAPDVALGIATPYYKLWRAGITGRNQVVGVIDSGLDMDSCYVWDPTFPAYNNDSSAGTVFAEAVVPPFNVMRRPMMFYSVDGHRKILMYNFEQDTIDSVRGHGTHVITSIIGSPLSENPDRPLPEQDYGQGVAFEAKAALIDVGQTRQDGTSGGLYLDALSLSTKYQTLKQAQSFVTVNSWGTEEFANSDNACYSVNLFAFNEQNTLHVFPAGNNNDTDEPDSALLSRGTINNPGICANGLTVGATENFIPDGVTDAAIALALSANEFKLEPEQFLGPGAPGSLSFMKRGVVLRNATLDFYPGFLSSFQPMEGREMEVVMADPPHACTRLSMPQRERVLVLVRRDGSSPCTPTETINNVYDWSKSGGAIISDTKRPIQPVEVDVNLNGFPVAIASSSFTSWVEGQMRNGTVMATWNKPISTSNPPYENVASFSAFGSSRSFDPERSDRSARIKPELVAPGYILAGMSDGKYAAQKDTCMAVTMAGTSMAAAQVGGAALMVRQYFLEGYYPSGLPQRRNVHFPSGPLIKATLIAGAAAMKGVSRINTKRLEPPPSQFQGFGRIDITAALPLADDPNDWRMQVLDRAVFNNTGMQHNYDVDHSFEDTEKPLIVVLAYYDYPAFPGAPNLIVNDLDVAVRGPLESAKPQVWYPNNLDKPDPVNTIEKIVIDTPSKGTYRITVTAKNLSPLAPRQQYSLVVLGGVRNTIYDDANPAVLPQPSEPTPIDQPAVDPTAPVTNPAFFQDPNQILPPPFIGDPNGFQPFTVNPPADAGFLDPSLG